ncbi:MAG TPA: hypothetical protein VJN43_14480 [Bryobacteraceae bacterium]|nr:hypothetical protein [Bryobacteraceae bacterium]
MRKFSAMVLGLGMALGTVAFAAQNAPKTSQKPATTTTKATKKHHKKVKKNAKKENTSASAAPVKK